MDKRIVFDKLHGGELLHCKVYRAFAERESNAKSRCILEKLSSLESQHASLWAKISANASPKRNHSFAVIFYVALRQLLGLSLTIKLIEHKETQLYRQLAEIIKGKGCTQAELRVIRHVRSLEVEEEATLEDKLTEFSPILTNIRDITFGMNDGLVEIVAVVVGLGAALQNSLLVSIAGLIVAVSGALSMAGGAYISNVYEREVHAIQHKSAAQPVKSAAYVGFAYILAAMVPLSPFAAGYVGSFAILLAIFATAVVLAIVAAVIAVITDSHVRLRVISTLLITLGIAALTILLGYYVRQQFGISL